MDSEIFRAEQTRKVIEYARDRYGDELEFLWQRFPKDAVLRCRENQKWYAVLMAVSRRKLGLETDEEVEIIDLRFAKNEALDFAASNANVYPGYHMNKNNWITIILDGSMATEQVLELLDQSYRIAAEK